MEKEDNAKTLHLKIKPVYLQQILHGFKTSEYREKSDYYKGLLVEEETADRPADEKNWTRCLDGRWRKFKHYSRVKFKCGELGSAEYEIKSIDAASGVYVIRLGAQLAREPGDDDKENKEKTGK